MPLRVLHVVGARPNFMKIAPLMRALATRGSVTQWLVHTGQHYDQEMSATFFRDLQLPEPDINLDVGSGSHAVQTAEVMKAFEPVLGRYRPDLVVLVGDVNSTLACALVAAKTGVPVVHVEAGLRSRDRQMPEEINRVLTDRLADLLFTPSRDADANLLAEGIPRQSIHFVGNIMIDSLRAHREAAATLNVGRLFGVDGASYSVVTLHRPCNVDDANQLREICSALAALAERQVVLFPMHPRTRKQAERFGLMPLLARVRILPPVGYLEMLALLERADVVLTDSGGVQEETTALGVPCVTLRDATERPVTVELGTNTLVPVRSGARILEAIPQARTKRGRLPEKWDGRTAERIVAVLADWYAAGGQRSSGPGGGGDVLEHRQATA